MAKPPLRIPLPTSVDELLHLGNLIYTRHKKDDAESPLNTLKDFDWNVQGPDIALALEKHELAEALMRQAEKAYRDRDKLMGDIKGIVMASRDLLKGAYKKTPKKLGDWGFEVHDTPKAKKVTDGAKTKKTKTISNSD